MHPLLTSTNFLLSRFVLHTHDTPILSHPTTTVKQVICFEDSKVEQKKEAFIFSAIAYPRHMVQDRHFPEIC